MIQKRNMWLQLLLFIVTAGLYSIYWYHITFKEMAEHNASRLTSGFKRDGGLKETR